MIKQIEDKMLKGILNKGDDDMNGHTEGNYWISDRRLWFNHDKTMIVEEGDERAASLYCGPGSRVPMEMAIKHGMITVKKEPPKKVVKQNVGRAAKATGKLETKS